MGKREGERGGKQYTNDPHARMTSPVLAFFCDTLQLFLCGYLSKLERGLTLWGWKIGGREGCFRRKRKDESKARRERERERVAHRNRGAQAQSGEGRNKFIHPTKAAPSLNLVGVSFP